MTSPVRPTVRADWTTPIKDGVEEGKLELSATIDDLGWQLASIVADPVTGEVWFEVYPGDRTVQISMKDISRLLDSVSELELWHKDLVAKRIAPA